MNLPPKQTFGKGKRARIPNKRYSDISLFNKGLGKLTENGSEKIESENDSIEISIKEEPLVGSTHSVNIKDNDSTSRKTKMVDLADPKYLKPFKYGWRRELVWRATYEQTKQRIGDIYYYTPQGKKVRSMREVSENLKNRELSLDNFSYFKAPLGLNDPEKEIIRDAKKPNPQTSFLKKTLTKSSPRSPKLSLNTNNPDVSNLKYSKLTSPKVSSPKVSSPKISSPKVSIPKVSTQKVTSPRLSNSKITTSKLSNAKVLKSKVIGPKSTSPKLLSPKKDNNKTIETTVKTRAAVKSTQKVSTSQLLIVLNVNKCVYTFVYIYSLISDYKLSTDLSTFRHCI